MMDKKIILDKEQIQNKIFTIRGLQVMFDSDLAELYETEPKRLNEQVKRNLKRFPENFMFQLNKKEYNSLRSQNATLEYVRGKHRKYLPYVFTEQGVSMLSAVLKSKTAIDVSIKIINSFVQMRKFISQNAQLFQRLDTLELKQFNTESKVEKIFEIIESKDIKPKQGIFFDGQIFDAYVFVSDLIKSTSTSIVLIDNYVDETVLMLLSKRNKKCKASIYTKNISKQLELDLKKYNKQYPPIEINKFDKTHDRFLIIDNKEIYHFGASLKDLGKKWFAFSKFEKGALDILGKLNK